MEIIWSMIGRIDLHEGKDPGSSDVIHVGALAQIPPVHLTKKNCRL